MRESKIEKAVCDYAEEVEQGCITYKFTSPGRANVPDRAIITNWGFTFYIEFKATGKTPSSAQWREIRRMREQGCTVYVIDDIGIGLKVIDDIIDA